METEELADPQGSQVLVKMLASTLNPSDVNTVRTSAAVFPKALSNAALCRALSRMAAHWSDPSARASHSIIFSIDFPRLQIEGTYAVKPTLPAVAGHEGVGVVIAAGPQVKNLKVNDWVIPAQAGFGACSHCVGFRRR